MTCKTVNMSFHQPVSVPGAFTPRGSKSLLSHQVIIQNAPFFPFEAALELPKPVGKCQGVTVHDNCVGRNHRKLADFRYGTVLTAGDKGAHGGKSKVRLSVFQETVIQ